MSLSQEQIQWGFWNWNRSLGWPPNHITYFRDYQPSERLSLNITQLDRVSYYRQTRIVEQWCSELPILKEVKYLWFVSRVNQKMFDAACRVPNVEGLFIKWSGIKSLEALRIPKNLRHLWLGSSAGVESIDVLGELDSLFTLELQQLNRISDFSVLSKLTGLVGLGIDGSMWTAQKIDTLEPLGNLRNLKYLTLVNTRLKDKSLDPILNLTELVRFDSSWNYSESEFEKLKALPRLKYGNVETSWKEVKAQLDERLKDL
jgi:Leucine-rich repeat (LRR) protein